MTRNPEEMLQEIFAQQVFELYHLQSGEKGDTYAIPYMMNDALESYLVLENCRMTGSYIPDYKGKTTGWPGQGEEALALVVRQGEEHTFTLWFDEIREVLQCYQYHQIGHFWVKGQEHWRQLVYQIGTIYDKYEYIGEQVCNEEELKLLPLMECAPFRYWSPIHESLDESYADTPQGEKCMEKLAKQAGERWMVWLFRLYGRIKVEWVKRLLGRRLSRLLAGSHGFPIYELIREKIAEASAKYPQRDYGDEMNAKLQQERDQVTRKLIRQGYTGEYPVFQKGGEKLRAVEEHPFTVTAMEYEEFKFRIRFMIMEGTKVTVKEQEELIIS